MDVALPPEATAPRLREVVAAELRRLILAGHLVPGDRVVEDRLAEQLGVSRNPVREAIRVLEAEGFVNTTARRGAVVATLDDQQADDMFEVRLALEPLGARLAARASEPHAVRRMRQVLDEAQDRSADRDLDHLADLHSELHSIIFEMTGNAYLVGIAIPMVKRGQWLLRQKSPLRDPRAWAQHHDIIAAIEVGDPDLAEAEARRHVLTMRHELRATASPEPTAAP
ncbi:GntR family transcriptional regulator [Microlunatus flavus]|uniref:DNA-binding transcriptional regulator, GntR family n=1 Tax=Microlunatus flavus TaxID=1036181 RepID=A0A1H9N1D9_9ACTN|nr:GntR family transcriptional regulator [Microlunatus flavus]SER29754.1 DNA-binding transcriptional regulator, GntR family [Microlunatus flavus]